MNFVSQLADSDSAAGILECLRSVIAVFSCRLNSAILNGIEVCILDALKNRQNFNSLA